MKDSRLLEIVRKLTKQDLRALQKFLHSPFFNKRKDVIGLFEYILEEQGKRAPNWEVKTIFAAIYPKKKYKVAEMRLVMSYLLRLIEEYLALNNWRENKAQKSILLAQAYRKRNLPKQAERIVKEGIKSMHDKPLRNADRYQDLYQLQFEQLQLDTTDLPTDKLNRQQMSDTLDIGYLIAKLRQACLNLAHQAVYNAEFDLGFLEELIPFLKTHKHLEEPAIAIYYHCYFTIVEPEKEAHFASFKELLIKNGTIFPDLEIRDLYLLAINYCIKKINQSKTNYYTEVLDLYKESLKTKHLLKDGILSRFAFNNIVTAGIRTGDFEWVAQFIPENNRYLEPKYRPSTTSFTLAHLAYSRKNYGNALDLLQKSNYRDVLLNLSAKMLLLKIFYELKEIDTLESHIEAMKSYIKRKYIIAYHRTNYLNIIHFVKKSLSLNPYDREEKAALRQRILEAKPLTEKEWLLGLL